jgi:hypothetical protein
VRGVGNLATAGSIPFCVISVTGNSEGIVSGPPAMRTGPFDNTHMLSGKTNIP